jgi:hypothetical protein
MLVEIICALAVLITLRLVHFHIHKAIEQDAELEAKVLLLTVKVRELRELNITLAKQNQVCLYEAAVAHRLLFARNITAWQLLGRKYVVAKRLA